MKLALVVLGGALFAIAGGGCGDAPSCEDAIKKANKHMEAGEGMVAAAITQCKEEKWSPTLRSCLAGAGSRSAAGDCMRAAAQAKHAGGDPMVEYAKKSKRNEAELNLDAIKKSAKTYYVEMAEYPRGSAGPTPDTDCCMGPNRRCAPDPALWAAEVWQQLDFEVTEPHFYQYAYESTDGQSFTARAIGDLDCDSTKSEYILQGTLENGNPVITLTKPTRVD